MADTEFTLTLQATFVIYVLFDSADLTTPRYVGQTLLSTFRRRLVEHLNDTKPGHKMHWIRSVVNSGRHVEQRVIAYAASKSEANTLERRFIKRFRSQGHRLTNATDGGDGVLGFRPTEAQLTQRAVIHASADFKEKQRLSHLGKSTGVRNGSYTKPDRRPTGDRHGSKTKPERVARGERSGQHVHPERTVRGERVNTAKMTWNQVRLIRLFAVRGVRPGLIAAAFGLSYSNVRQIITGRYWKEAQFVAPVIDPQTEETILRLLKTPRKTTLGYKHTEECRQRMSEAQQRMASLKSAAK